MRLSFAGERCCGKFGSAAAQMTGSSLRDKRSIMQIVRKQNRQVMLQRQRGKLEYLAFPILDRENGIRHLFSTRLGGVSEGIYSTMNLSYTRGDRKEAVDENFRRIAEALGCTPGQFVLSDQKDTVFVRVVT